MIDSFLSIWHIHLFLVFSEFFKVFWSEELLLLNAFLVLKRLSFLSLTTLLLLHITEFLN